MEKEEETLGHFSQVSAGLQDAGSYKSEEEEEEEEEGELEREEEEDEEGEEEGNTADWIQRSTSLPSGTSRLL